MHSSRHALRHSCTAHNAYNLNGALARTFCSGWTRRQEASPQNPADKTTSGTYSGLERLSQQFGPDAKESSLKEGDSRSRSDPGGPPESARLQNQRAMWVFELLKQAREEYRAIQRELANHVLKSSGNKTQSGGQVPRRPQPRPISTAELRAEDIIKKASNSARYQDPPDVWFNGAERHVQHLARNPDHRILMQWFGDRANRLFGQDKVKKMSPQALQRWRKLFDYKPRLFLPLKPGPMPFRPDPYPWEVSPHDTCNGMEQLEVEIARFGAYMENTPAEKEARARVVEETLQFVETQLRRTLTKQQKSKIHADIFGSETTGLATATSDLDIRVHYQWSDPDNFYFPNPKAMQHLCRALDASDKYILAVYRRGKFEIISCQHKASGLDIQIVCSPDTSTARSWIQFYLDKMPHLRNIFFLMKTALSMRGLVDVFNGGIGSYGLFWMIVAALERRSSKPPITSAEQLRHFLDFYSTFDFTKYGLSIFPTPKAFLKHDFASQQIMGRGPRSPVHSYITAARRRGDLVRAGQWSIGQTRPLQPYLFCLQDPADPVNDLGRKTNAIKHLQTTLRGMKSKLDMNLETIEVKKREGDHEYKWSLVAILAGSCHEVYRERRWKVAAYGESVAESGEVEGAKLADGVDGMHVEADDLVEEIVRDAPDQQADGVGGTDVEVDDLAEEVVRDAQGQQAAEAEKTAAV
ncbi:polynucleotide adenylyltransferase [Teratosphaeria destructans]|uniref:Polynucleotide adenylyltransferase n=1 Tax=Teratosphaeria destructans TaxID=418781 RepID=A0A9W7STI6_9PEZI|nr:polynucleotide adenylyltransferase [Teratosphaeria destructans]